MDAEKLTDIWESLKGKGDQLNAHIRWSEIGFQGKDPSTDFRGMGMLAVINLKLADSKSNLNHLRV